MLLNKYSMPSVETAAKHTLITGADIIEEDSKVYYTLTYRVVGYELSNLSFYDGTTTYEPAKIVQNGLFYTFKFDATRYNTIWPHLKLNGQLWDGANHKTSTNGDVKFAATNKKVTFNGKTYELKVQWEMPTVVVS
jgi:hypothetical protein